MRIVIVAAHPDDEMIGAAAFLSSLRRPCTIVHVTDGAPRTGDYARNAGCRTWQEYAVLRRREFGKALKSGEIEAATLCFGFPDQQAAWHIADLTKYLAALFEQHEQAIVLTHPYEGGHPDHDSTAVAVHAAVRVSQTRPRLLEFASYHAGATGMECECFVGDEPGAKAYPDLTEPQRMWKRGVLDAYVSQADVLAQFPLRSEPLRIAPRYDFSRPPHPGCLYYEKFDWGVNAAAWRMLAGEALRSMGIPCVC